MQVNCTLTSLNLSGDFRIDGTIRAQGTAFISDALKVLAMAGVGRLLVCMDSKCR